MGIIFLGFLFSVLFSISMKQLEKIVRRNLLGMFALCEVAL